MKAAEALCYWAILPYICPASQLCKHDGLNINVGIKTKLIVTR